jgi:S-DNA-T family DNA segregation ATPase FtsK/SpoIIIE
LTEKAVGTGIYPVWLSGAVSDLPAACRTVVEFDAAAMATVHFVRLGSSISPMVVEGFTGKQLRDYALALARVIDAGAVDEENADLPRIVPLVDLLGRPAASEASAVVDRWQQNGSMPRGGGAPRGYAPKLRALVGQAATGALHVDLRTEGPHALVGGTTGSGKSEFLQAWVLGMAAEYSPQRVTFLFVDYKGGSAFADCVTLPHSVGLVTDLSPHLVRRALVSLRAELHYREHLFNAKGAKDILELEKRGDPECPPALVLVIDEFAALVSEVPDFVDGVVDIGQRGRSLGIHLIMATQRPAGVIKDNLRANTNLRVALRMADESDSMDVVGTKLAAQFPPEQRGRGAVKSGPGRVTLFQAAYSGGHAFDETVSGEPEISSLGFAPPQRWERKEQEVQAPVRGGDKPTDQQRLVATMRAASDAAQIPAPRRPWLDDLPAVFDLATVVGGDDRRIPIGLIDVPQHQQQAPLLFEPETDQNMAIFGAGGSGRTGVLRALAISAGCVEDGSVHVYVIDAGGTGLTMLEAMPHVGSVVSGDDSERVMRLSRMISTLIDERTAAFGSVGAESLLDYRTAANAPHEARVLVLIDNFPSFRAEYEGIPGRAEAYASLARAMQEGRSVGVHVVVTADRSATINNSLMATIQKKLVLRMADSDGYSVLGVPRDMLNPESPVGRGAIGKLECQVGVWQGLTNARDLKEALLQIAGRMPAAQRPPAPPIQALPTDYSLALLPTSVGGGPVLALSDVALAPHPLEPTGTVLVAGGSETGKTTTMLAIAQSLVRWRPDVVLFFLGARRTPLSRWPGWDATGLEAGDIGGIESAIVAAATGGPPVALFVESATDFSDTPTESVLQGWLRTSRMDGLLVVAEADPQDLGGYSGLKAELKAARRGMVLRPETSDGEGVLKTPFPRVDRSEFTPGRGLWAANGKVARIQMPRPFEGEEAEALLATRPTRTFESIAGAHVVASAPAAKAVPDWAKAPTR